MATVDMASNINAGGHRTQSDAHTPYLVSASVNFATATTTKGSALATGDVIQVLDIPAETIVLMAGVEITTVTDGASGVLVFDLGTGDDADAFIDGFDADSGTAAGTYAQTDVADFHPLVCQSADTVDITLTFGSGGLTTGAARVFALLCDISDRNAPGVAAIGS
jgi:hypothetical protein